MLHQTQFKTSFKGRLNKPQWRTFMQPISAFQPPETTKLQSYPLKNPSLRMLITTSPFETKIQGWNGNPKNVQEEVHLASCLQSSIIGPCFFGTKNVCLCVCVSLCIWYLKDPTINHDHLPPSHRNHLADCTLIIRLGRKSFGAALCVRATWTNASLLPRFEGKNRKPETMHRICSDEVTWKGTAFPKKNFPENSIGVDHWNLWCWLGKEVANFILFLGFLMVYRMRQSSQVVVYLIPW